MSGAALEHLEAAPNFSRQVTLPILKEQMVYGSFRYRESGKKIYLGALNVQLAKYYN